MLRARFSDIASVGQWEFKRLTWDDVDKRWRRAGEFRDSNESGTKLPTPITCHGISPHADNFFCAD